MASIDQIKTLVTAYEAATGLARVTLSWRVFNDSGKLKAIMEDGADLQTRRFDQALRWFAANWPEGAAWPDGVGRPEPETEAAA